MAVEDKTGSGKFTMAATKLEQVMSQQLVDEIETKFQRPRTFHVIPGTESNSLQVNNQSSKVTKVEVQRN